MSMTVYPPLSFRNYGFADFPWIRAVDCYRQGQFEDALAHLNRALRIHPYLHELWGLRARCYTGLFEDDLALSAINMAIALKQNEGEYYLVRGQLHNSAKRVAEATADFQYALTLGSEDARKFLS